MPPGTYRNITGNLALSYGLIAGGVQSGLSVFLGSYPITPASDILHELSKHKAFGVTTFQAEDEIAGVGAAIGASFAGQLGVTTTSGPGVALKSEAIGLAVMTELPLVVVDVQRGGPSTGLPTKTEQADLLQAMFGRNGEAPVPDRRPAVARRLLRRRGRGRPDRGHLPHAGDAPLRRLPRQRLRAVADPDARRAAGDRPRLRHREEPRLGRRRRVLALPPRRGHAGAPVGDPRHPRPRAPHRRAREGRRARQHLLRPRQPRLHGPHPPGQGRPDRRLPPAARGRRPRRGEAKVLVLGWGSTYGPIGAGVRRVRKAGYHVAQAHLRHLNPFPSNLGEVLKALRQGAGARDEPRPALAAAAREVPRRRRRLQRGPRPAPQGHRARRRHRRPRRPRPRASRSTWPSGASPRRRSTSDDSPTELGFPACAPAPSCVPTHRREADRQGLHLRPGGALVPGLRRLRRAQGRAVVPARPRPAPREHRLRLRHRLLLALPLLPRHLRHALDPRPRADDRHRHRHRPRGPRRSGSSPATATRCRSAATT